MTPPESRPSVPVAGNNTSQSHSVVQHQNIAFDQFYLPYHPIYIYIYRTIIKLVIIIARYLLCSYMHVPCMFVRSLSVRVSIGSSSSQCKQDHSWLQCSSCSAH
jgi:hypothetical protein